MERFKLTSASATADEALAAADQLEQAIGEICNGQRRAGNVPMEPMAVLVQFVRDVVPNMAQLEGDRDAFEAAGESARDRLALRMEELQQAVQARLAAEAQTAQLMAELEDALDSLEYVEKHLSGLAGYGVRQERITSGRAAIAAVKGGAA